MTRGRLSSVHALLIAAAVLGPVAGAHAGDRQKQVLVLFGSRPDAQFSVVAQRQLPSLLTNGMTDGVDYYSEYLDVPRFADPAYQIAYLDFVRLKYKAQRIDLVMVMGSLATEFMARLREVFPGSPVVFYGHLPPTVRLANSTGIVNPFNFRRSLDLAVALQSDLEHVFVVSGASASDRLYEQQARREFLPLEQRIDFTYLSGLVTRDLEARLRTLPPRSAVFVVLVTEDGAGERFQPMDSLSLVASIANAPTYSWADAAVDSGILGGNRRDQQAEMRTIASLAVRVLRGERADDIPVSSRSLDVDQVDWRQLRRWQISEARVPAGATILFREPSVWDRYKGYIVGSVALMLAQATLIAGLLLQRSKRRRAELELQRSQSQLRTSYDRIRHLGRRLLGEQEAERTRVARELHDDIGQQLAILSVDLDALTFDQTPVDPRELTRAQARVHSIVSSVHELSLKLHPAKLQLLGLVAALGSLRYEFSPQLIAFSHRDVPQAIDSDVSLCLFRVAQEALRNAVTHSGAEHVLMDLTGASAGLALTVTDDGHGFDVATLNGGLGLTSMKERIESIGGVLDIDSASGSGTRLTVTVPIRPASTAAPSMML